MYAGNSTTFCLCIVFNVGFKDIEVSINRGETANLIIQQIGNEIGGEDIGGFPEGQLVPLTFHPRTTFETFVSSVMCPNYNYFFMKVLMSLLITVCQNSVIDPIILWMILHSLLSQVFKIIL